MKKSKNKTHDQNRFMRLRWLVVAALVIVGHPQSRRLVLIFLLSTLFLHKHHREAKRMKIESCLMSSTNTFEPSYIASDSDLQCVRVCATRALIPRKFSLFDHLHG